MPANTTTKVIKVVVKDSASQPITKISNQMGKLNKNMKKTAKTGKSMAIGFSRMKTAFIGFAAAMGARQVTKSIDSYQLLKDRITALWGATQNTEETFRKLAKVANDTNAPIDTIADGFARMSISTKDAGFSVDQTIDFVKALQQTLRLSGSNVQEANSVFLQMGQAFGLSRLQGQELRAVMLGDAEAAKILAAAFKVTKGELRDLGEKGLLKTTKIFKAFITELDDLNERAGRLKITFGQAAVKIMNAFGIELDRLNSKFLLTTKAAKAAQFLIDNMESLFKIGTAIVASGVLYKVATGLEALKVAMLGKGAAALFGPHGLVIAGVTALGIAASYFLLQEKKMIPVKEQLIALEKKRLLISKQLAKQKDILKNKENRLSDVQQKSIISSLEKKLKDFKKEKAALHLLERTINDPNKPIPKGKYEEVNNIFRERNKITEEFITKLKEQDKAGLDQQLAANSIHALSYGVALVNLNEKYDKMLKKLNEIKRIDNVFSGIQKGAEDTIKSIGTVAEQIAGVTMKAFGHLEDALFDFTKTGKVEFRKFAMAILDDINRMIIRMAIIKPLAGALVGGLGGAVSAPTATAATTSTGVAAANYAANGNAYNTGNVIPFARGGIVNRETTFGMSNGRTGVMGEDGPEAILPLSRGANGKLGVAGSGTVVNIINNSTDVETETKKSTGSDGSEQIDVYIVNKVGEAIGEGQFDRSFQQLYGLNRKGQ